jgi:glycosyltransferase involved in cell wall biosynthesis
MRVCKIWDADYPWDVRVEKVVDSLTAGGHAVDLVCRNQMRRASRETIGSLTIHRLPVLPPALGACHGLWGLPHPLSPVWMAKIARTIRAARPDLILVRDLPLALPAALLGAAHRLPVVFDNAENYPAMLADRRRYMRTAPLERLVRHPATAALVERLVLRMVDHVIVVVDEARDRIVAAGVAPDRVTIVSNTPRASQWQGRASAERGSLSGDGVRLVYLGNLDGSRGVDVAIRAVRRLADTGDRATLAVIGDGPSLEPIRDLARELGVGDRVTLVGRLSQGLPGERARAEAIITAADIGIIPHYATDAWNTTVPNKLFDYMALGLPVLVSDARPAARIVRTAGCGEVFRDRDVEDFARSVRILADPGARRTMALEGRAAIERRFNWSHDSQSLLAAVERVGSRGSRFRRDGVHGGMKVGLR